MLLHARALRPPAAGAHDAGVDSCYFVFYGYVNAQGETYQKHIYTALQCPSRGG